jgi:hypothetical protein
MKSMVQEPASAATISLTRLLPLRLMLELRTF